MIINDQVIFSARMDKLETMMAWTRKMLHLALFPVGDQNKVEIAVEEALVNVIRYAYGENGGDITLSCRLDPTLYVEFTIRDSGIPFNPLLQSCKEPTSGETLEEKREGGLGILFMRNLMDDVHYERAHSQNILILRKNLQ